MELPPEAIKELIELHCRLTGEMLTNGQASEMGQNLFRLILAAYEPIPREWIMEIEGQPTEKHQN
jgi:hypothetical protein